MIKFDKTTYTNSLSLKHLNMSTIYDVRCAYVTTVNRDDGIMYGNWSRFMTTVDFGIPVVQVVDTSQKSITLKIQSPEDTQQKKLIDRNILNRVKIELQSVEGRKEIVVSIGEILANIVLADLNYYMMYDISVSFGNGSLYGKPSAVLSVRTKAVYMPPTNVTVLHVTHDAVILRIPPPTQNKHDRRQLTLVQERLLTHMKVRMQSSDSDVTRTFNVTDDVVTLRNLRRLTYYNVTTSYGNGKVFGEPSNVVRFQTKVYFDSPAQVAISQIAYRTAWVSVALGEENKGYATQMKILLMIEDEVVNQYPVPVYQDVKFKMKGLLPNTNYTITVAVGNGQLFSNFTDKVFFKTKDDLDCKDPKIKCGQNTKCLPTVDKPELFRCKCNSGYQPDGNSSMVCVGFPPSLHELAHFLT
ncbi:uncharacterized protein [Clytia hemisphaerica]|uniref:uncharacterized protein n=1 Tax=Clytia hemisphaerica TaxID=252671 RepID=UPI0034D667D1